MKEEPIEIKFIDPTYNLQYISYLSIIYLITCFIYSLQLLICTCRWWVFSI